jgi:lysozyme
MNLHSPQCVSLVASFEGMELRAYQDQGGIWTLGYGHTADVKEGDTCTQQQAEAWLSEDLETADIAVNKAVTVPLTQNHFDALVSLCFNIGQGNFAKSTLVRILNAGSIQAAADQFLVWDKVGGQTNAGLLRRRNAERALFLTPGPWAEGINAA